MVTPRADIDISIGDTALSYTTPRGYYFGNSGVASSYDFLLVMNRTQLEVANASELFLSFECSAVATSNFTYYVNYSMYLRIDLRYQREIPNNNSFPSISLMVVGLCSTVILGIELSHKILITDSGTREP